MSDPNSFLSFSDYLGLNPGVADEMRKRTNANYKGPREEELMGYADDNFAHAGFAGSSQASAGGAFSGTVTDQYGIESGGEYRADEAVGDGGQYDATDERIRTGTASYSEFLNGMASPADRQALMEKTYGKGRVTSWDSAMIGDGEGVNGARDKIEAVKNYTGDRKLASDKVRDESRAMADEVAYEREGDLLKQRRQRNVAGYARKKAAEDVTKQRRDKQFAAWKKRKDSVSASRNSGGPPKQISAAQAAENSRMERAEWDKYADGREAAGDSLPYSY